ncbi:MAG TPA: hypothetical protein PLT77_03925, partial [Burkholderiaceae bacterium]|nr:hypothetical protein [Burkholderiaceae bacterium]
MVIGYQDDNVPGRQIGHGRSVFHERQVWMFTRCGAADPATMHASLQFAQKRHATAGESAACGPWIIGQTI